MDWIFIGMGLGGALLTSTSWLPQIIKAYQTRRLVDLSWATLGIFWLGTLCWLGYGIWKVDWLIIGANAWTASNITLLLVMKAIFSKPADRDQSELST